MTTKRALAAMGLGITLAVAAVACGGQSFPTAQPAPTSAPSSAPPRATNPQARLLAAVQRATEEKTARVALHTSFSAGSDSIGFDGSGAADLAGQRMDLRLVVHSSQDADQSIELRLVDRVAYIDEGGTWTSTPLNGTATTATVPDPTSYLAYLQGVSNDVRADGRETLRGDDTTRYSATVDLARALARTNANGSQRAVITKAIALFGNLEIPVTVWVDDAGRLRKVALSMDLSAAAGRLGLGAGTDPKIEATVEFYDFGAPVQVAVPAGAVSAEVVAQDRAAEADLRNALTAEKTYYTDQAAYSAAPADLKAIEPTLDWGGRLSVVVGGPGPNMGQVVCLAERSRSGTSVALADVASGPLAGTYYAKKGCPASVDASSFTASTGFSSQGW